MVEEPSSPVRLMDAGRTHPLVFVFLVASILGGNFIALKYALEYAGPATVQVAATGVACIAMFTATRGRGLSWRLPRSAWTTVGTIATLFAVVASLALAFGVDLVEAGLAALLISFTSVITVLLRWARSGRRPTARSMIGVVLGVAGVATISLGARSDRSTQLVGVVLLLVAAVGWALSLTVIEERAEQVTIEPFVAWTTLIALPPIILVAAITDGLQVSWAPSFVLPILYIGVLSKAFSLALQMSVVRRATAVSASAISLLVPIVATVLGVVLLGERLAPHEIVSGVLILSGVVLAGKKDDKTIRTHS